jgi:Protein of unknown function (DUF3037)
MAGKRQFELLLLRLVPHALRDDFMTVGVVVVENKRQTSDDGRQAFAISEQEHSHPTKGALGAPSAEQGKSEIRTQIAEVKNRSAMRSPASCDPAVATQAGNGRFVGAQFTRDWKRVECFAPDLELEIFEHLERAVRERLGQIRGREELLELLAEKFGTVFDVGPVKALEVDDPAAEMKVLARDYLDPMRPAERGRDRPRHTGRLAIVGRMQDAFAEAGVLEMLQRDMDMQEFTGENDPFHADFGFRVGKSVKMFHALALNVSRDPAVTLAYRYGRIRDGMRARGQEAFMTAVVSTEMMRKIPGFEKRETWGTQVEVASGIAMLRANEVAVRGVEEMGAVAEEIKRELQA